MRGVLKRNCGMLLALLATAHAAHANDTKREAALADVFERLCLTTGLDAHRMVAAWDSAGYSDRLNVTSGTAPDTGALALFYTANFSRDGVHVTFSGRWPAGKDALDHCAVNVVVANIPAALDRLEKRLSLQGRHVVHEQEYLGAGLEPHVQRTIRWRAPRDVAIRVEAATEYATARPIDAIHLSAAPEPGS